MVFHRPRASNIAKWILVVMTLLGLLFVNLDAGQLGSLAGIASLAVTILQLVAIVLLFRADARAWLTMMPMMPSALAQLSSRPAPPAGARRTAGSAALSMQRPAASTCPGYARCAAASHARHRLYAGAQLGPEFYKPRRGGHARQCSGQPKCSVWSCMACGSKAAQLAQWRPSRRQLRRDLAANILAIGGAAGSPMGKHGSCMARKPATYFRVTRILWTPALARLRPGEPRGRAYCRHDPHPLRRCQQGLAARGSGREAECARLAGGIAAMLRQAVHARTLRPDALRRG